MQESPVTGVYSDRRPSGASGSVGPRDRRVCDAPGEDGKNAFAGLLTVNEAADATLSDLVDNAEAESRSVAEALPAEVRDALFGRLRDIRAADYRWKPFLLGSGPTPYADPARLRRLCDELGVG